MGRTKPAICLIMTMILFDTDVLIDHLRGVSLATDLLKNLKKDFDFAISVITLAEIESGIRPKERDLVEKLLKFFHHFPVTDEIAKKAGFFKQSFSQSHSVFLPDALIAATAFVHNIPLYTLNSKHYPMTDVTIHIPYRNRNFFGKCFNNIMT